MKKKIRTVFKTNEAQGDCISCDKKKQTHELCLDCAIKLGRDNPGWISVKERKPKSGRLVMIYTPEETILKSHTLPGAYWSDTKDWTVYDFERCKDLKVTHWMPMPKLPQGA